MRRPVFGAIVLSVGSLACELTEVTIPVGESVIVVHSVLNVGQPTQFVILEWSLVGDESNRFFGGLVPPAPAGAGTPVEGAIVTLTHQTAGNCASPTVQLVERPPVALDFGGTVASGTYTTNDLCPLAAEDRIALRVKTLEGEVLTGTTTIPGARSITVSTGGGGDNSELHRGRDSVRIDVDPISARALALELGPDRSRSPDLFNPFRGIFTLATDTMGVVLAGDLLSFEDNDEGEAVFTPGRYYTLTVAVVDTNYFDFVRSFSDPLTGRGFINHVQGGIGVFGSVSTAEHGFRITDDQVDPREGLYRISGTFDGTAVDILLDLYLEPLREIGFSAFVDGTWVDGPISTSADGSYLLDGDIAPTQIPHFEARFFTFLGDTVMYTMTGMPAAPDSSFDVRVTSSAAFGVTRDTLFAVRVTR